MYECMYHGSTENRVFLPFLPKIIMKKRNLIGLAVALSITSLAAYRLNGYIQPPVMNMEERVTTVSAITVEPQPLTAWVFTEGTAEAQRKAFFEL